MQDPLGLYAALGSRRYRASFCLRACEGSWSALFVTGARVWLSSHPGGPRGLQVCWRRTISLSSPATENRATTGWFWADQGYGRPPVDRTERHRHASTLAQAGGSPPGPSPG